MKLYLISNGDISCFEGENLAGRTDISLESEAKNKLEILRKSGYYHNVDAIFSAPLKRCIETAAVIYPFINVNVENDFNEYDYGDFEGQPYDFLKNNDKYLSWLSTCGESSPFGSCSHRQISASLGYSGAGNFENIENFYSRLRRGIINSCKTLASRNHEVGAIITTLNVIMNIIPVMIESPANCLISGFDAGSSEVGIDKYQFKLNPGHGFEIAFDARSESFKCVNPMIMVS